MGCELNQDERNVIVVDDNNDDNNKNTLRGTYLAGSDTFDAVSHTRLL